MAIKYMPTPREPQPDLRERSEITVADIRSTARKLVLDFVRNSVDFSLSYANLARHNPGLSETWLEALQRSFGTLISILSSESFSEDEVAQLRPLLDQLHNALGGTNKVTLRIHPVLTPIERDQAQALDVLTPRELEVLQWIAKGFSTKQVAHHLGMSYKTAACHRYRIMEKLEIHEVANLVRYAIREGLVEA